MSNALWNLYARTRGGKRDLLLRGASVVVCVFVAVAVYSHRIRRPPSVSLVVQAGAMPTAEVETPYKERPPGSESKLRTFHDGARILRVITRLVKEERPLAFFTTLAAFLALASAVLALPVVLEFWRTGLVPRLPTAVLATGLMLTAVIAQFSGMVLDTVTRGRKEMKRLAYLSHKAVH